MNEPISTNGTAEQIAALQRQVFALLLALIVVSGTLTVYLYRQASIASKDLAANRQVIQVLTQNQNAIASFANQLVAYAQTHPDFRPVLQKYGISGQQAPAQTAPAPKK